jgi:hypothetical protein
MTQYKIKKNRKKKLQKLIKKLKIIKQNKNIKNLKKKLEKEKENGWLSQYPLVNIEGWPATSISSLSHQKTLSKLVKSDGYIPQEV